MRRGSGHHGGAWCAGTGVWWRTWNHGRSGRSSQCARSSVSGVYCLGCLSPQSNTRVTLPHFLDLPHVCHIVSCALVTMRWSVYNWWWSSRLFSLQFTHFKILEFLILLESIFVSQFWGPSRFVMGYLGSVMLWHPKTWSFQFFSQK